MNVVWQMGSALAAVGSLLGLMTLIHHAAIARSWSAEVQRKLVHVATGVFALALPWLFADDWPVYLLLALALATMAVLRLPNWRNHGAGATLHQVGRQSYGDFLLTVSVGLLFLFAGDQPVLYVLPLAVLTLGDAAAALAGSAYGRRFFRVAEDLKSLEGSAIFFLVTLVTAMISLLLLTAVPRLNVIVLALMVAAFATVVEADSWKGYDNLFLPLGVFVFLSTNQQATPRELIFTAGLFLTSLVALRTLAPPLALSRHAARVYAIAVFLLLSITAVQNAVLPILMLAAHTLARWARPLTERYPDLDIVATLALVSFGAMALGHAFGPNALSFYALATGSMALILTSLAAAPLGGLATTGLRTAATLGTFTVWLFVVAANPPATRWHGTIWPMALGVFAGAALTPALAPAAFSHSRALKVALLAATPSLTLYLILMFRGETG
ncbi:hypothetical protein [Arhodomonas sp. AD133]|uniref:hypothetical protein n=1 Tax=Arhodomonas sp. AD133 TaxID=3415009 RepID=UPI003EBD5B5C